MDDRVEPILSRELDNRFNVEAYDSPGVMKEIYLVQTETREMLLYLYPEASDQRVATERAALSRIAAQTGVRVPKVFGTDESEYLLCERLHGDMVEEVIARRDRDATAHLVERVGRQLAEIHSVELELFGCLPETPGNKTDSTWTTHLSDWLDELSERNGGDSLVNAGIERLETQIGIVEGSWPPVMTHEDPHLQNVFLTDSGEIAFLDFEWSFAAPREYDVWKAVDYYDIPSDRRFLEGYGQDRLRGTMDERRRYYELFHATKGILDTKDHGCREAERRHRETVGHHLHGPHENKHKF